MLAITRTLSRFGDRLWLTRRAVRRRLRREPSIAAELALPSLEREVRRLLQPGVKIDPHKRARTKAAALAAFEESRARGRSKDGLL